MRTGPGGPGDGSAVRTAGAPYRYLFDDGRVAHYGTLLEVDPPRRLVQTFEHDYFEQYGAAARTIAPE